MEKISLDPGMPIAGFRAVWPNGDIADSNYDLTKGWQLCYLGVEGSPPLAVFLVKAVPDYRLAGGNQPPEGYR